MSFGVFQFRRGTAAGWTSANPVLASGELALETDTSKFKIGDGTTAWNSLAYGGLTGPTGPAPPLGSATPTTEVLGDTAVVGTSANASHEDHKHAMTALSDTTHGTRAGGTLHANATSSVAGFMASADKAAFDHDAVAEVNLLDFGADPTATSDNTTAFTNAMAALPALGGIIVIPNGFYLLNSTVTVSKTIRFIGQSQDNTVVRLTHATNDGFLVSGPWNCSFENMKVDGVASTTSGAVLAGATSVPVNELSNFPTAGSASYGGTAGWVTISWTGKSASTGAGNLTGTTGVTAAGAGANVMIRTGGYAINLASGANYNSIQTCHVYSVYHGVFFASALGFIDTLEIRNFAGNAVTVSGNNDKFINRLTTATSPLGTTSVLVQQTSSLLLQQCQILSCAIGLDLNPGTGVTVPSVEAVNCFFDNNAIGMRINATGTGSIYRSKFSNCWFSSGTTAGVQFNTVNFDGISFVNCDFYGNGTGIAANVVGGGHWMVASSRFAQNTTAIALSGSAAHFAKIIGNEIGPTGAFAANTTGISVAAGTYKGVCIENNAVIDNTTNFTLGAVTVAVWSNYRITDNAGINPRGVSVAPAVPATTVAATNTSGFPAHVYLRAGTITAISINGVATGITAAPSATGTHLCRLSPGGTIAITFSVAPTWVWIAD